MISPLSVPLFIMLAIFRSAHSKDIPGCIFHNTVDLSHTHQFPNSSYLFQDKFLITPDQVNTYDYEIVFGDERVAREPHPRGCLCRDKIICIQFCCHPTQELFKNGTNSCGHLQEGHILKYDPYVNVLHRNWTSVRRNAITDFAVLEGVPCHNIYPLQPDIYSTDQWDIYENGGLMRYYDEIILKKSEYCLMPVADNAGEWKLSAFICPTVNTAATYNLISNILGIISIFFTFATALLYILLPELRSLRGKCLIHYILSLAVGNVILIVVSLREGSTSGFMCSFMGFAAYFCYESSFIWANVIGYDLWQNYKIVGDNVEDPKRFRKYMGYTYGIAAGFTLVLIILEYSEMSEVYKPGIGGGVCWLNTSTWSAMFYFFGPNAIIFCFSLIFLYLLNSKKVSVLRQHLEQTTYINIYMKSIRTYFLLLCILGTSWCFNVGSYVQDLLNPKGYHFMNYISDMMNFLEGPLIFWVLAVRTKAMYLLIRRKTTGSAYVPQLTENSDEELTSQF